MSADGSNEPGATLRLLTTPSTGDLERARQKLRALAGLPGPAGLAELDRINAASRVDIDSLLDASSRLDSLVASATRLDLDRLGAVSRSITEGMGSQMRSALDFSSIEESQKKMAAMFTEFEEARIKHQEMFDMATTSFEAIRSVGIPDMSGMLGGGDPSRFLDNSINERALRTVVDVPPNPIYETNSNLERILAYTEKALDNSEQALANSNHMLAVQREQAKDQQKLNETTAQFLSVFSDVAQKTAKQARMTSWQTWMIIGLTVLAIATALKSSDDLTDANQQMLQGLTDRIATMASEHAAERDAMLAEQRKLIEQLASTDQALLDQRAAIQELKDVLSQKDAPFQTPLEGDVGPP